MDVLARHPCGNLLPLARRAIRDYEKCRSKTVSIPMVKGTVRLSINWRNGPFRGCYNYWDPRTIVLFSWGDAKAMAFTLVHEMRHVQQHAILGKRFGRLTMKAWGKTADRTEGIMSPLEIDAKAAEIVARGSPNRQFLKKPDSPGLARMFKGLEKSCRRHARLIG